MLAGNKIEIEKEKDLPRDERATKAELESFVRQHPGKKLLGTNFYVWVYNAADSSKNNWWNRFKRRIGREPVLLDSSLAQRSAAGMKIYLDGKGFLESKASFRVDTSGRKARVVYDVRQGEPYRIGGIDYDFRDRSLQRIVLSDTASSLLRRGNIFDANVLGDERVRIASYLKDRGYYNFSINNISYAAD